VKPSLAVRGFWYGVAAHRRRDKTLNDDMRQWMARNRYLPYGEVLPSASDGSIMTPFRDYETRTIDGKEVRVNRMFERHPEYFALKKDGTRDELYVGLSTPAVLDVTTAYVDEYFQKNPNSISFPSSPPDGAP